MPAANSSPRGGSSRRGGFKYRSLPVWLQWLLPFGIAAIVVVGLVVFVRHQTDDVPLIANVTSKNAIVEQNREDNIIVRQQQAPHTTKLAAGVTPVDGIRTAVVHYMKYEIDHGVMDGPIVKSSCTSVGTDTARQTFHCSVTTSAQVTYPFLGVVQPAAGLITYCQRVAPPVPTMNVPVDKRCT